MVFGHSRFRYRSLEEIEADVERLGLDIEFSRDTSVLAQPVCIGSRTAPNALAIHPMEGRDADPQGNPGELTFRRYMRYARGGAGLIWFEASAVWPEGRSSERQLLFAKGNRAEWEKLLTVTRKAAADEFGPRHRPICIVQLHDAGRYRKATGCMPAIVVRNLYLDPPAGIRSDHPVMTDSDIETLEEAMAEAAVMAWRVGFDGADIKSCHRYLVSDLLSAHTREGKYGGSFEGRARFLLNVVDRVREQVSEDFLVTTRLNLYDAIPYPYGWGVDRDDAAVPDLSEPLRLVGLLRERGVKIINTSSGTPYFNPHVTRPYDAPVRGISLPDEHPLEGVARAFGLVAEVQKVYPDLVVVGSAYSWLRQFLGNAAAANIRNGRVSIVGVGRTAFAYPDFARDLIGKGRLDSHKVCIACSLCSQLMRDGSSTRCVTRDREIYGPIYKVVSAR